MQPNETVNIFFDMDGTIAQWNNNLESLDQLFDDDYFYNLLPIEPMLNQLKRLCLNPDYNVNILSAAISQRAQDDKLRWIEKHIPEFNGKILFCTNGYCKADMLSYTPTQKDILIDDYSKNLLEWEAKGGRSIKVLNGINHTLGQWKGQMCWFFEDVEERLFNDIKSINDCFSFRYIEEILEGHEGIPSKYTEILYDEISLALCPEYVETDKINQLINETVMKYLSFFTNKNNFRHSQNDQSM